MAANLLTVCPQMTAGGGDSRYVHVSPSGPSMRGGFIHPDLSCRYQNRVLIIYTLCTVFFGSPALVPLQLHNNKLSFQAVHQFCTSKSHIYTMKALSNRSAMFFRFGIYTMAWLMKCMLSFSNYQPDMEQQEHVNIRRFPENPK